MMYPERSLDFLDKAEAFFWARVLKTDEGCWKWTGGRAPNGYGITYLGFEHVAGKRKSYSIGAHKFSWILQRGGVPKGLQLLHQCDRKHCVNPDHMKIGTSKENIQEAHARGLSKIGSALSFAKLTESIVAEARKLFAAGTTAKALAKRFGVAHAVMHAAIRGKTWRHVK
jgi:hypothetical protein